MNTKVYRAILSTQIQPNASKHIDRSFRQQMDNDPKNI